MRLTERLERDGAFLFRWRGLVPLVLAPLVPAALLQAGRFELAHGEAAEGAWLALSLGVAFLGLAVRWATVGFVPAGTSGRNARAQRAERLNTTGMYSIVRNPLYLGNALAVIGVAAATTAWWFVVVAGLVAWLYVERIIAAEEAYLAAKFGADYARWVERTPAFLPRLRNWRAPDMPFSARSVLRREYTGPLVVLTLFLVIEAVSDLAVARQTPAAWLGEDGVWLALFGAAVGVFLVLRALKKRTTLLRVEGR